MMNCKMIRTRNAVIPCVMVTFWLMIILASIEPMATVTIKSNAFSWLRDLLPLTLIIMTTAAYAIIPISKVSSMTLTPSNTSVLNSSNGTPSHVSE